jgi:hypothetical protein
LIPLCFSLASKFLDKFSGNTVGVLDISKLASFLPFQMQIHGLLIFKQVLTSLTGKYTVMPIQMGPAMGQPQILQKKKTMEFLLDTGNSI